MLLVTAELAEVLRHVGREACGRFVGSGAANLAALFLVEFDAELDFERFELRKHGAAQASFEFRTRRIPDSEVVQLTLQRGSLTGDFTVIAIRLLNGAQITLRIADDLARVNGSRSGAVILAFGVVAASAVIAADLASVVTASTVLIAATLTSLLLTALLAATLLATLALALLSLLTLTLALALTLLAVFALTIFALTLLAALRLLLTVLALALTLLALALLTLLSSLLL